METLSLEATALLKIVYNPDTVGLDTLAASWKSITKALVGLSSLQTKHFKT